MKRLAIDCHISHNIIEIPVSFLRLKYSQGAIQKLCGPIFVLFDHLPTYRGLSWTFGAPPTPCPRGHIKT